MVMGRRPDVPTAPAPIAAMAVFGLTEQIATTLATVPFRRPWEGSRTVLDNVGTTVTRQVMRSFMGYATSLETPEFRSLEVVLDDLCRVVMPPVVRGLGVDGRGGRLGDVPVLRLRPRGREPIATICYLHGGGYIGTSPAMYSAFAAWLAREACCEVVVADYRLAPEFPFPAGLLDVVTVYESLLDEGIDASRLFVAGDSGGGGLANSLLLDARAEHLPSPAGLILFSPEVDLELDSPSVSENAATDILPWNIPVGPYLHGTDLHDALIDVADADLAGFPPTFVVFGGREMFRDPIRAFIGHLEAADVEVSVIEEPELFHVYPILMPWLDASRRAYRGVAGFIADHVEQHQAD